MQSDISTTSDTKNTKHNLTMTVDLNVISRRFEDYLNSVEMWLETNCEGNWSISVSSLADYKIPQKVDITFEKEDDAIFFKLSPFWSEKISC